MKITFDGITIELTVTEFHEYENLREDNKKENTEDKPKYAIGGYTGTRNEPHGMVHEALFCCDACKQPILNNH